MVDTQKTASLWKLIFKCNSKLACFYKVTFIFFIRKGK
jgi:hypothetical protein